MAPVTLLLGLVSLLASAGFAATDVPAQPLARPAAVIVSDDFQRTELGKTWRVSTPTFIIVDGVLKGSHTFKGSPAANGRPARPSHGAVALVEVGRNNAIVEFKFRFAGATSINAVFDDVAYKESHGGHICRVALLPNQIRLGDDKESMRHEIVDMRKDPRRKAEAEKLIVGRVKTIPAKLEPGRWYRLRLEVVEDEMRAVLDDQPIGYLKSSGIAHPTKSRFHFTVNGGDADFDDFRIWSTERD
jgi:hypothetical protein